MSALEEFAAAPVAAVAGPKLTVDLGADGGEFTGLVTDAPIVAGDRGAFDRVYALAGLDPTDFRIVDDSIRFSAWEQSSRTGGTVTLYAYRARFARITASDAATEDLAPLMAIAKANARRRPPVKPGKLTRVVVISDAQVGKVGSRGGTPALLERVAGLLGQLDRLMVREPCEDALVIDPGDLIEGFENVPSQKHMNDLSHPAMLRVARALLTDAVTTVAARHRACTVTTVSSNHSAWRAGKAVLGKPSDDYGIDIHMAVHEALSRDPHYRHVEWRFPDEWDESLAIPVRGAVIGVAHGHQAQRPDGIPAWWRGQSHGTQSLSTATILVTGHHHHFRAQPSGFIGGHSRQWFMAPTLDNGSDWYRNISGDESEPGILTFTIDDRGRWDNLHIINPAICSVDTRLSVAQNVGTADYSLQPCAPQYKAA